MLIVAPVIRTSLFLVRFRCYLKRFVKYCPRQMFYYVKKLIIVQSTNEYEINNVTSYRLNFRTIIIRNLSVGRAELSEHHSCKSQARYVRWTGSACCCCFTHTTKEAFCWSRQSVPVTYVNSHNEGFTSITALWCLLMVHMFANKYEGIRRLLAW